jgi:glycosyltransferase involved in cell wall biosynthesis
MNILMLTNTFTPHVGGVARSVQGFARELRRKGHRVLIAAPLFRGSPEQEEDVIRVPAVQDFNGSDFSVPMPESGRLVSTLRSFQPEVVHAHHPFLLGGTALRIATARNLPLVFTHHTMYDKYMHYVPGNPLKLRHFVRDWVTGYCNLCDAIIAPSLTVAETLRERGVRTLITVIPTGVDTESFAREDGVEFRSRWQIPADAFVVGHVGRLAPEKNLAFLSDAVARFLGRNPQAYYVVVGAGPSSQVIRAVFENAEVQDRVRAIGILEAQELAAAYRAIDVFAFASHTETQGMVLTEAMAAGVPVVAVAAPGVKDLVRDGYNGKLLRRDDAEKFASALAWVAARSAAERRALSEAARVTAAALDMDLTADKAIDLYESLRGKKPSSKRLAGGAWQVAQRRVQGEWKLLSNVLRAATESLRPRVVWEVGTAGVGDAIVEDEEHMESANTVVVAPAELPEAPRRSLKARVLGWVWARRTR